LSKRYFDLYDLAPVGYCTLNEAGLIVQAILQWADTAMYQAKEAGRDAIRFA
jgi:GGDEF domain-containing protein